MPGGSLFDYVYLYRIQKSTVLIPPVVSIKTYYVYVLTLQLKTIYSGTCLRIVTYLPKHQHQLIVLSQW